MKRYIIVDPINLIHDKKIRQEVLDDEKRLKAYLEGCYKKAVWTLDITNESTVQKFKQYAYYYIYDSRMQAIIKQYPDEKRHTRWSLVLLKHISYNVDHTKFCIFELTPQTALALADTQLDSSEFFIFDIQDKLNVNVVKTRINGSPSMSDINLFDAYITISDGNIELYNATLSVGKYDTTG